MNSGGFFRRKNLLIKGANKIRACHVISRRPKPLGLAVPDKLFALADEVIE